MEFLELDRIVFLLTDDNFTDELKTFRRSFQRLKVRLRNNRLNGELKQVKTLIHRLEVEFPVALFEHYRTKQLVPKRSFKQLRVRLCQYIHKIDAIITKATLVYGTSQSHFRVGHLVQHYLVVRASLARLIFCFKALLVYSVDLYLSLSTKSSPKELNDANKKDDLKLLTLDEAKDILLKHNCKPRPEPDYESPEIIEQNPVKKIKLDESIGELIDRDTLRPVRACRRKK